MSTVTTVTTKHEREFLQRREVEEIMGVSAVTIWRWTKDGILPKPTKVGHINYFKRQDIMDLLNGKTFKTDNQKGDEDE